MSKHGNVDSILGWSAPHIHFTHEQLTPSKASGMRVMRTVRNEWGGWDVVEAETL